MADFFSCTNNSIGILTLLQSLIAKDSSGMYYIKTVQVTANGSPTSPISCDTQDDFVQLFNQSIVLADDGYPAIRVVLTDFANGAGLSLGEECGVEKSLELLGRMCFVYDTNDNVAINLANIT